MDEYFLSLIRADKRGFWPGLQRFGLRALSIPYGWAMQARNWLFDHGFKKTHAVAVPVISVGNLTLGGTGKTPCVEFVARFYHNLERRVALLSRGYASKGRCNDEALVLEDNLPAVPHLQGKDRVALARSALQDLESQVLVMDDGFQHRRLRRDLDLVLIDATAPWGYGYLFPRGLLRESPRGLRRADLVVLTRCDLVEPRHVEELRRRVQLLAPNTPVVETTHRPSVWVNSKQATVPLEKLVGRSCAGFCGIGNPDAFRRTLSTLGMNIVDWRVYPDHHAYTPKEVAVLKDWANRLPKETIMLTTQKDLVKIRLDRLGDRELWALQIQLKVLKGMDVLEEKLQQVVRC